MPELTLAPVQSPVGALLVDMTGAQWLEGDDVVTEMVERYTAETDDEYDGTEFYDICPLSASTTLTTIEVP